MNSMQFRTICDRCGRVTVTTVLPEVTFPLYQLPSGEVTRLTLCPEHRAEFERFVSNFLGGVPA